MTTVLITGANRGIGFGLARHYLEAGATVIAACRTPSKAKELKSLKGADRLQIHKLDVTSDKSVAALKDEIGGTPVDILYNNAGVGEPPNPDTGSLNYDAWIDTLKVNTQGPLRVALAFQDNLKAAKGKLVTVTSGLGSIGALVPVFGHMYAYRTSKAAVNMAMRLLSLELGKDGVTVVLLNPGWVRTDLGGPQAPISVDESARGIIRTISAITPDQNGIFVSYDGTTLPW